MISYTSDSMGLRIGIPIYIRRKSLTSCYCRSRKIKKAEVSKKAIFLNNDHGMLSNGMYLLNEIQKNGK